MSIFDLGNRSSDRPRHGEDDGGNEKLIESQPKATISESFQNLDIFGKPMFSNSAPPKKCKRAFLRSLGLHSVGRTIVATSKTYEFIGFFIIIVKNHMKPHGF